MEVYTYSPITREYIGIEQASKDIMESKAQGTDVYILPACASFDPPLLTSINEVAILNENNERELVPDFRGTEYWLADGSHFIITEINVEPPAEALMTEPEPVLTEDELNEQKIQDEITRKSREDAVAKLIADGDLPVGFIDS